MWVSLGLLALTWEWGRGGLLFFAIKLEWPPWLSRSLAMGRLEMSFTVSVCPSVRVHRV